jgi:hypothetical protein
VALGRCGCGRDPCVSAHVCLLISAHSQMFRSSAGHQQHPLTPCASAWLPPLIPLNYPTHCQLDGPLKRLDRRWRSATKQSTQRFQGQSSWFVSLVQLAMSLRCRCGAARANHWCDSGLSVCGMTVCDGVAAFNGRRGVVLRVAESCCSLHIIDPHLMFDRRLANRRLSSRWLGRCRWPRDIIGHISVSSVRAGTDEIWDDSPQPPPVPAPQPRHRTPHRGRGSA